MTAPYVMFWQIQPEAEGWCVKAFNGKGESLTVADGLESHDEAAIFLLSLASCLTDLLNLMNIPNESQVVTVDPGGMN